MRRFFYFLNLIFFSGILISCGLQNFDAPPVTAEDRWIKKGYTKNDIWNALTLCGYDNRSQDEMQREKVENCMLEKRFIYIDSPYGEQGAVCKYLEYEHRPSCQSLRKRMNGNEEKS